MKWLWTSVLILAGCSGVPEGLHPVTGFDADKYLGHWYEIARLDHSFERGLDDVTADYRKLPDGRIEVINRGFDAKKNKWNEAKGVARFQGKPDVTWNGRADFALKIDGTLNQTDDLDRGYAVRQ